MLDLPIIVSSPGSLAYFAASSLQIPTYGARVSYNDADWSHQERPPRGKLFPNPQLVSDTFLDI